MSQKCKCCGNPYHEATGHVWSKDFVLCGVCAKSWWKWLKARIAQMSHPIRKMKESFHDAALKSIKVPKDSEKDVDKI